MNGIVRCSKMLKVVLLSNGFVFAVKEQVVEEIKYIIVVKLNSSNDHKTIVNTLICNQKSHFYLKKMKGCICN